MKPIRSILSICIAAMLVMASCKPQLPKTLANQNLTPTPEWAKNAVIYEVNIRQYTPEGTFAAFEKHLTRLHEMGVDILWLMPVHPIGEINRKGSLGSYYSVQNYTAVNPSYGTLDDLKHLVAQAHQLGMKVIIDWVANHTAWDNPWVTEHPDFYAKDSTNHMYGPFDWTDVAQLDYKNQELRKAMTDALAYWVSEANIDGFRCDVAGMVPVDFWEGARADLEKIKPVFMLAENEDKPELLHKAFNANYGWEFHHIMNKTAQVKDSAFLATNWFAKADSTIPAGAFAMQFTSNHDENSWNGTEYERMGNAAKTYAALTFTVPGMPLIYSGQEAGLNRRLSFFEKDSIAWSNLAMADFYKKLINLKDNNLALANGAWGGKAVVLATDKPTKVIAFERSTEGNKVISIFNLSSDTTRATLQNVVDGNFTDYFANTSTTIPTGEMTLLPWEFKIYTR